MIIALILSCNKAKKNKRLSMLKKTLLSICLVNLSFSLSAQESLELWAPVHWPQTNIFLEKYSNADIEYTFSGKTVDDTSAREVRKYGFEIEVPYAKHFNLGYSSTVAVTEHEVSFFMGFFSKAIYNIDIASFSLTPFVKSEVSFGSLSINRFAGVGGQVKAGPGISFYLNEWLGLELSYQVSFFKGYKTGDWSDFDNTLPLADEVYLQRNYLQIGLKTTIF
jgi:hypothetical protein